MPKIRNIIIFIAIAAVLIMAYLFFIRSGPPEASLVSSQPNQVPITPGISTSATPQITQDFLTLLLNIQNIKLDDSIFFDPAFLSLRDSSIVLIPDGDEGRPNPFAPIGSNAAAPTILVPASATSTSGTSPAPASGGGSVPGATAN